MTFDDESAAKRFELEIARTEALRLRHACPAFFPYRPAVNNSACRERTELLLLTD